jgi:hypothetical protein
MNDASTTPPAVPLAPETWVVVTGDQVSADLQDETVILAMRDGVYYGLDHVGSRIWSLAAAPTSLGAVHAAIVAEYDVEPAVAWNDLAALATELIAAGLLVRTSAPAR